ncbi:MAG: ATP-binding protein [Deltaproteobacteria bacterium]|nr:ATP-binding protein [Deltaproteobacteria bacterium]
MAYDAIKLIIDSDLNEISLVRDAIGELRSRVALSNALFYEIELCVVEAATNCIKHAYGGEKGHEVEIDIGVYGGRLIVHVCDTGEPMDIQVLERANASALEVDENALHLISEKGRGLPIMKAMMDRVLYERTGKKNCLTLIKDIGGFGPG